jgi:hypothetical protein
MFVGFAAMPARAQSHTPTKEETQVARELFEKALLDERGKDYAAALEKLEKAIALYETPGLRFHLAFCEEKLGHLAAALADYDRAKRNAEIEGKKDVLAEVQGPLASLSKRVPRVVIRVQNAPKGDALTLTLDERPLQVAVLGTDLPVDPGRHRITARATGYAVESEVVDASEGATQAVNLTLHSSSTGPTEPATTTKAAPAATGTATPPATGAATAAGPAAPAPKAKSAGATPWLLAGGGVVLAGGGVAALLIAGNKASTAKDQCATVPRWAVCGASSERGTIRALDGLAIGAFVGAAALFTTAIVTGGHNEESIVVSVAPQGISLTGVFQ